MAGACSGGDAAGMSGACMCSGCETPALYGWMDGWVRVFCVCVRVHAGARIELSIYYAVTSRLT